MAFKFICDCERVDIISQANDGNYAIHNGR